MRRLTQVSLQWPVPCAWNCNSFRNHSVHVHSANYRGVTPRLPWKGRVGSGNSSEIPSFQGCTQGEILSNPLRWFVSWVVWYRIPSGSSRTQPSAPKNGEVIVLVLRITSRAGVLNGIHDWILEGFWLLTFVVAYMFRPCHWPEYHQRNHAGI